MEKFKNQIQQKITNFKASFDGSEKPSIVDNTDNTPRFGDEILKVKGESELFQFDDEPSFDYLPKKTVLNNSSAHTSSGISDREGMSFFG